LKKAYFDCFSGISGDMCLGAVIDAGVSIKELEKELKKIPIGGYRLTAKKVKRSGFTSTKVDIDVSAQRLAPYALREWKDIEKIINRSRLSEEIKQRGRRIFKRLFEAEAKVHGGTFERVHLHELGAVDCIVDIFGTIIGLNILGIEKVFSSPINLGSGFVETEAGILPVPTPATVEILKKVPVYSKDVLFELTTPTGAAIIKEISSGFGDMPPMDIGKIGIGAGNKDFKDRPNILRLFIGNPPSPSNPPLSKGGQKGGKSGMGEISGEKILVIETCIDDMNPQIYEYAMEKFFKAGALDVYFTQVLMKKGRPGVKMTVLCNKEQLENLMKIVLKETSTIGLRFYEAKRRILHREIKTIDTEFGKVRVKFSRLGDDILKATPEYEDCKRIAKKLNIPLIEVMKKVK
jgi:uncharacterized protein (TIGR00299 family) protein